MIFVENPGSNTFEFQDFQNNKTCKKKENYNSNR